jgi:Flp pilus assembly pilin Flp
VAIFGGGTQFAAKRVTIELLAAGGRGQSVIEYGLLIATIAVVVLLGVTAFGAQIHPWFQQLAAHITTVGT